MWISKQCGQFGSWTSRIFSGETTWMEESTHETLFSLFDKIEDQIWIGKQLKGSETARELIELIILMVEPEHRNALKVMLTKQQKSISMVDLFNSIYSRLQ